MSSSEGVCSSGSAKAVSDRHSIITTDIIVDITFSYMEVPLFTKNRCKRFSSPTPDMTMKIVYL